MNKIITLIALLVIASSACAWNIDYSKYAIITTSVSVEDLVSLREIFVPNTGFNVYLRSAHAWNSVDNDIVITKNFASADNVITISDYQAGRTAYYDDLPKINELPAFIRLTASSGKTSDGISICSGPNCDRLIKEVIIDYYVRSDLYGLENEPYIESQPYNSLGALHGHTGRRTTKYIQRRSYYSPTIPTSHIPVTCYGSGSACITNIKVTYLVPRDETAMGKEFAQAYETELSRLAKTTIYEANLNPTAATYSDQSPADVNNDNEINSADVTAVFNYIMNGAEEYNGHAYVDLGLPSGTMWAACNVGAVVPEAWGNLYAYGEKTTFNLSNPEYAVKNYIVPTSEPTMTEWNGWHYPTAAEVGELKNNTTATEAIINGNECCILTSNINGKQLVFPLCGHADRLGYHNSSDGYYWTARASIDNTRAYVMNFATHMWGFGLETEVSYPKSEGLSIRMTYKP